MLALRAVSACIARLKQSVQDGLLHVHAIFGLVENERVRAIEDFRGDFQAAVRRKAVHKDSVWGGKRHQFAFTW